MSRSARLNTINAVKFRVARAERALDEALELLRPAAGQPGYAGPDIAHAEKIASLVRLLPPGGRRVAIRRGRPAPAASVPTRRGEASDPPSRPLGVSGDKLTNLDVLTRTRDRAREFQQTSSPTRRRSRASSTAFSASTTARGTHPGEKSPG